MVLLENQEQQHDESEIFNDESIDSIDIFDELKNTDDLVEEVQEIRQKEERDMFFYIALVGKICSSLFFLLLFSGAVIYSYIYVQTTDDLPETTLFDPICSLLLPESLHGYVEKCSGVGTIKKLVDTEIQAVTLKQSTEIEQIVKELYETKNFLESKKVIFLQNKKQEKFKVVSILEEFDNLKYQFDPVEQRNIQCANIQMNNKGIITMQCDAYSVGTQSDIRGFEADDMNKISGTSMTIANSFLNFVEKKSKKFKLINKQKIFTTQDIVGSDTGFTHKTSFGVTLKDIDRIFTQ